MESTRTARDNAVAAVEVHITGIVQGVGFRPFVYGLAEKYQLNGWVRNTSAGVDIVVEGEKSQLDLFVDALEKEAPPLAHIDTLQVTQRNIQGFAKFEIVHSQGMKGEFQPISADVSICEDCLRELLDPNDRRYRYPFINCTNCGPRFTIIKDIPYDRPNTTMAGFPLCENCASEYQDPHDRRFHAQPVACPKCGPHVWLEASTIKNEGIIAEKEEAIRIARLMLAAGKILAVKGIGGFHLVCDATNPRAVQELRKRKLRVDKAFAVMFPNIQEIERNCIVGASGHKLLESVERPIVILERRNEATVCRDVAPGQNTLGVMLPYTPLHYLLLEREDSYPTALVMTSGNLSEEPIVTDNQEARERLGTLADGFLLHNRDIQTRCDDSVTTLATGNPYPLRRSRGYAPAPKLLPWQAPQILATGAELKNTFCLTRERYAFLSHHIGDLENYETFRAFEQGIAHFQNLFQVKPEVIAYDLHPDYMATKYAMERASEERLPVIGVQHHHAHIAACLADNNYPAGEPVIGVSFDGTGYGEDGAIWGGEFFVADYHGFVRSYHLQYAPLPGGDLAVREPWRLALAFLWQAGLEWEPDLAPVRWAKKHYQAESMDFDPMVVLEKQIVQGINTPQTSSAGRVFDAVSSLIGLRHQVNYEAQAAIELETIVTPYEFGRYNFHINEKIVDLTPAIRDVVEDWKCNLPAGVISARFHNTLAVATHETCRIIRRQTGINTVALSGGVWQNKTLLGRTIKLLQNDQFDVIIHSQVPTNDGGIALGQAVVALHRTQAGRQ